MDINIIDIEDEDSSSNTDDFQNQLMELNNNFYQEVNNINENNNDFIKFADDEYDNDTNSIKDNFNRLKEFNLFNNNFFKIEIYDKNKLKNYIKNYFILKKMIEYFENESFNINQEKFQYFQKNISTLFNFIIQGKKDYKGLKNLKLSNFFIFNYFKLIYLIFQNSNAYNNYEKYDFNYIKSLFEGNNMNLSIITNNLNKLFITINLETVEYMLQLFNVSWNTIKFNPKLIEFLELITITIGYNCCLITNVVDIIERLKMFFETIAYFKNQLFINHIIHNRFKPKKLKEINYQATIINFFSTDYKEKLIDYLKNDVKITNDFNSLQKFETKIYEETIFYLEKLKSLKKYKLTEYYTKSDKGKVAPHILLQTIINHSERKAIFSPIAELFTSNEVDKIFEINNHFPNLKNNILNHLYIILINKLLNANGIEFIKTFVFSKISLTATYLNERFDDNYLEENNYYPIIVESINHFILVYKNESFKYKYFIPLFQHFLFIIKNNEHQIELDEETKENLFFFIDFKNHNTIL